MPELTSGLTAYSGRLEMVTVAGLSVRHLEQNGLSIGANRDSLNRLGRLVYLGTTVSALIDVGLRVHRITGLVASSLGINFLGES